VQNLHSYIKRRVPSVGWINYQSIMKKLSVGVWCCSEQEESWSASSMGVLLDGEGKMTDRSPLPLKKLAVQNVGNSVNDFKVLSRCKMPVPGMEE